MAEEFHIFLWEKKQIEQIKDGVKGQDETMGSTVTVNWIPRKKWFWSVWVLLSRLNPWVHNPGSAPNWEALTGRLQDHDIGKALYTKSIFRWHLIACVQPPGSGISWMAHDEIILRWSVCGGQGYAIITFMTRLCFREYLAHSSI